MRACTHKIITAFLNQKPLKTKNVACDGESIRLHDNLIAWRHGDAVYCTLAGWGTPTTRERLNGLARMLHTPGRFHQQNHVQYYNGAPIGDRDIIRLK